ncbi:polyhydroxyalkanoic acid system family protein [Ramlibacter sp.]|uniref:polyhydroxyalkanoic acid system family protein n=1 Tax=Ramlibacter sp. TaxID=1917967 RepID=UPI002D322786|nr:polyhydroxyalkanoic acid system family protein [Ramlibacter sp.]HYD76763.1 polyhydroxyalkanoic acid system family protein [Ramlibacter sp.]
MPDIHIEREHSLGLPRARELAFKWAEAAEDKLDMECTYEEGKTSDLVSFTRSGVNGELRVTRNRFELHARLGLLLGAFKDRIETEITRNLDELLQQGDPVKAFEHGVAEATARHSKGKAAAKPAKAAARSRKA